MSPFEKLVTAAFVVLVVGLFLFFTPLGGIVNLILGGGAVLGAIALLAQVAFGLFSFRDYGDLLFWREMGLKLVGAMALFVVFAALQAVLPPPPLGSDRCIEVGKSVYYEPC